MKLTCNLRWSPQWGLHKCRSRKSGRRIESMGRIYRQVSRSKLGGKSKSQSWTPMNDRKYYISKMEGRMALHCSFQRQLWTELVDDMVRKLITICVRLWKWHRSAHLISFVFLVWLLSLFLFFRFVPGQWISKLDLKILIQLPKKWSLKIHKMLQLFLQISVLKLQRVWV